MCTASHNHHSILAHSDIATSRVAGVSISSFVECGKEENNSVTKGESYSCFVTFTNLSWRICAVSLLLFTTGLFGIVLLSAFNSFV